MNEIHREYWLNGDGERREGLIWANFSGAEPICAAFIRNANLPQKKEESESDARELENHEGADADAPTP